MFSKVNIEVVYIKLLCKSSAYLWLYFKNAKVRNALS